MLKNKLISVILPVWEPNVEQLRQCIDSILKQTYDNLEIIISYRKSYDFDNDFYSLISAYESDKRLRILENKKTGFTNSLNEAILNADGDFIARIDSDDYCEINRIEKQLEFKKKYQCNIVGTWAQIIANDGQKIGKIELPITHSEIRRKIMLHNPILHPSVLLDKKLFNDIGLYDTSFIHAEDYELWFRAMYKNYKFGNVPEYLIYIREATSSRTRGNEWREHRRYNIKVKNKAFFEYGFTKPLDILYHMTTPFTYFISPKYSMTAKKITGWYK